MSLSNPPPVAVAGPKRGVVAELTIAKSGQSAPLSAISVSSDQRHAVVGGHGIMKVIRIAPEGLSEVATLKTGRRKISGTTASKLSMYDVSWCPSGGHVAASLSNGGVAIWDLQHLSSSTATKGSGRSHGHYGQGGGLLGSGASLRGEETGKIIGTHERSVNRLCWNPFDHGQLLSGSQDGFLKIWDVRCSKEIAYFNSTYGAVRDVQYSPLQEFHFAAVFNNGKLQIWDYRISHPQMKISSHTKSALSVEWHHTMPWRLATSSEKTVKIWDLQPPTERQPPSATVREQTLRSTITLGSPGVVSRAKWRPGHPDQIATVQAPLVGEKDFAIMVHDVTDPAVAHYAIYGGDDKKNGFCWLDTPLNLENPGGVTPSPLSATSAGSGKAGGRGVSYAASSKARRIVGGSGRDEDAKEWCGMGVWQHLISISDQGTVRVHSLAKSTLPRRNLEVRGTRGFTSSARGEMCSWLHKRTNDPNIWKIYQNEQTQAAPGMFQEAMEHDVKDTSERRRSSSVNYQPPLAAPPPPQLVAGITQLQQQRIARSLSVGDGTASAKGRRVGGVASAVSAAVGPGSSSGQRATTGLSRSPNRGRPQSLSLAPAAVHHLRTGPGITGSPPEDSPPPRSRRARSMLTVYPVGDKPVALDVVNWRRICNVEQRFFYGRPQPRSVGQGGYGPQLTEHLTGSVILRGFHVRDLVAHNAEVYLRAGLDSMAHTWRMVGIMLSGVPGGLLLPLGATVPDIDVDRIDKGVEAAMAAVTAAKAPAGGDTGEGVAQDGMAGAGRGRELDAAAGRERDFSVPEVLHLIDKHEEEEEEEHSGMENQLTPEQRQERQQQQLQNPLVPPPQKVNRTPLTDHDAVGSADPKPPPGRAPATISPLIASGEPTTVANKTSSESGGSTSAPSGGGGGGGGGGSGGGVSFGGTGMSSSPPSSSSLTMWHPQPLRGLAARPPLTATGTATTMTGDDEDDDNGREDSDGETTTTTTFATTETVWWEHDARPNRGGGGGGGSGSDGVSSSHAARAAAAAASRAAGGDTRNRDGRPERQERLPDEVTLDWLWKSEIRDELTMMAEAGFAYDTVAVLEVVRSWYYGTGPGRDEEVEDENVNLEETCEIQDAPGFWLGTDIPNLQVRMWYMQGLEELWRLQLYSAATDIIKHCGDRYIGQMHRQNTTLKPICSGCGGDRQAGTSTWCTKCSKPASMCPLCELPVVGRYVECPVCHHGGHAEHMMSWFAISTECPVETCSHQCKPRAFTTRGA